MTPREHWYKLRTDTRRNLTVLWRSDTGLILRAMVLVFIPHLENDHFRKFLTIVFFGTWVFIMVAPMIRTPSEVSIGVTAVVMLIMGQLWNIEIQTLRFMRYDREHGPPPDLDNDGSDSE